MKAETQTKEKYVKLGHWIANNLDSENLHPFISFCLLVPYLTVTKHLLMNNWRSRSPHNAKSSTQKKIICFRFQIHGVWTYLFVPIYFCNFSWV